MFTLPLPYKGILLSLLIVLLLLTPGLSRAETILTPQPVTGVPEAQEVGPLLGSVLVWRLNVRSGPGTHHPVLTVIHYQEVFNLTGRTADFTWLRIALADGRPGWVYAPFMNASANHLSALPIIEDIPPPLPLEPRGYVTAYRLNVRIGPSRYEPQIGLLSRGQEVTLLGRNTAGTWLEIRLANQRAGWISARYIRSEVTVDSLPIVGHAPPPPPFEFNGYVLAHRLNVRSGPGLGYRVMGWLDRQQRVRLLGRNASATWLKAALAPNYHGWVHAGYIRSEGEIMALPVVE